MLDFSNQSTVWLRFDQDLLAATGSTTVKVWAVINHGDTLTRFSPPLPAAAEKYGWM
jgi:hypothetical protein